jgi:very-short-patch-repair endonuclease
VGTREARLCYLPSMRRVEPELTSRARLLRSNATPAERMLWRLLSRYRPKFTRQLPIGPYIADLACREARLVIEFDGSQHIDSTSDERRTRFLMSEGWSVIRFWNSEVADNPDGVAQTILLKAAECLGGTHPQPLPSREGRKRQPRFT